MKGKNNLYFVIITILISISCGGGGGTSTSQTSSIVPQNPKANFFVRTNFSEKPFLINGTISTQSITGSSRSTSINRLKSSNPQSIVLYRQAGAIPLTNYGDGLYGSEVAVNDQEYYYLEATNGSSIVKGYFQYKGAISSSSPLLLNTNTKNRAKLIESKFKSSDSDSKANILQKLSQDKGDFFKAVQSTTNPSPLQLTIDVIGDGNIAFSSLNSGIGVVENNKSGALLKSGSRYWTEHKLEITGTGVLDVKFYASGNVDIKNFVAARDGYTLSSGTYRDPKKIPMNSFFVYNNIDLWPYPPNYTMKTEFFVDGNAPPDENYDYLNELRVKAGMIEFSKNKYLEESAYNHAINLITNKPDGKLASDYHIEYSSQPGFTGQWPSDRALFAGYDRGAGENIAFEPTIKDSIDALFSAIYHRFGFLNFSINEVGLSRGNKLPLNSGEYMETADVFNMGAAGNVAATLANNPDVVFWPPDKSDDIPPAFYEEYPDPLPDYSVSGYPISITFNDSKVRSVKDLKFIVTGPSGNTIENSRVLNQSTDPNKIFTNLQYAFYSLDRLDWASIYNVSVSANVDGVLVDYAWSFKTRDPEGEILVIDQSTAFISLTSGKQYFLYVQPKNASDVIKSVSFGSSDGVLSLIEFFDKNTISICVNGDSGKESIITINGRTINLILGN